MYDLANSCCSRLGQLISVHAIVVLALALNPTLPPMSLLLPVDTTSGKLMGSCLIRRSLCLLPLDFLYAPSFQV